MITRIALYSLLIIPAVARAQPTPALYPFSDMGAASGGLRINRAGLPLAGQRFWTASFSESPEPRIKRTMPAFRYVPDEAKIADVQDIVFFAEQRVVRIRLHIKVADGALGKDWLALLKRYFDFLDRDGDGFLNRFEAEFVMPNRMVQQLLTAGQFFGNPYDPSRRFADLDRDGDGKISFDEFAAYYAPSSAYLVRSEPAAGRDPNLDRLNNGVFKFFDRNNDGRLTPRKIAEAEQLLPALDQNEDECLSALELVPNLFNQGGMKAPGNGKAQPAVNANDVLRIYKAGTIPEEIVEELLLRYDKDKNLRLSKAESGFDEATFARLDKNGSGELSIPELMAWKDLPPDLTVELKFNAKQTDCRLTALPGPGGKPTWLAQAVTVAGDGKAMIRIGLQQLDLGVVGESSAPFLPAPRAPNYEALYQQADPTQKGYFTEKDIVAPQHQYLRILFDFVDRNGDGRVTRKEFTDYFELQQAFAKLPLTITQQLRVPSLFGIIDANSDGRLCVRELRNAWGRLKKLEPDSGDFITRAALRPLPTVRLVRGRQTPELFTVYNPNVPQLTRGPLWFRKMDRNRDGDVSRSEFPGRPEDFDKLDLDHDGLISAEEAEAADQKFRVDKK
jgi:Ca2+-binding EF-hand superfamily protein